MSASPESTNKLVEHDRRIEDLESRVGELETDTAVLKAKQGTMETTLTSFGETLQRNTDAVAENTGAVRELVARRNVEHEHAELERSEKEKRATFVRWIIGSIIVLVAALHDHLAWLFVAIRRVLRSV